MPFTPLHMGPGMAIKALAGDRFSLVAFGISQVLIDLEPLIRIIRGDAELHGFTHTWLGALLVAAVAFPVAWCSHPWLARRWADAGGTRWFPMAAQPCAPATTIGVLVGTLSHVAIDSVMHSDMAPHWPFAAGSPLYRLVDIDTLHLACIVLGAAGLCVFALRQWLERPTGH